MKRKKFSNTAKTFLRTFSLILKSMNYQYAVSGREKIKFAETFKMWLFHTKNDHKKVNKDEIR